MLRPATPLSVLLFVAFGLLLISVLSTPLIQAIPLGSDSGVDFGVFGWCKGSTCSGIEIGYDTSTINDNSPDDFDLSSSTRSTLSAILIVHPVAALATLIMLILALVSHLHSPSHSARYLLAVFILSIIDFLICLLAFLVDVLLFVPHLAFGSYLVLAATVLVALSTLVSCAMRRTIVNRKARKKRIAENAEMSGENYYNRQAKEAPLPGAVQPTMPTISGANGPGNDKLPAFASYEQKDGRTSDERIPLTARSPAETSPNNIPLEMNNAETAYNGPVGPGPRRAGSRDQFGNPINQPADAYGMPRPSGESQRSRGRGGMPPGGYRGRGGYGPPRGGGYGQYGAGPGRGGYGPPGRGGYGAPPARGGYGPPPRGYGGPMMRGGRPAPPPPGYNAAGSYERRGPPAGEFGPYGARQPSPGPPSAPGYQMNNINPSMPGVATGGSYQAYTPGTDGTDSDLPRAESPPPLPGNEDLVAPASIHEMDASSSPSHITQNYGGQFRDSDADIVGMVGLQQGLQEGRATPQRNDTGMTEGSRYNEPESQYAPVRAGWSEDAPHQSALPPPLRSGGSPSPGSPTPRPAPQEISYVEDVDPRFADPPKVASPVHRPMPPPAIDTEFNENIPEGARSPAESERSNFTSISQRGINPRWPGNNPPPTMMGFGGVPARRPVPQQHDVVLDNNPDFQLPGMRGAGASRGRGGYPPGL
ncbi:pH-response regulator protein palI/prr-5 [Cytospora mali]|uniref:PH-response regulator protein palI/prr-5 n=1 Tax=Cytospora mali TaxID=578113 RepID=A0A194VDM5_CYTMA|nr:pH-response regulator protein palI/prr-5 [Valsa mali var. pyri (nom. inval.)]